MASRGVNKVILVGNLGQDPEVRYMPNGGAVANITLATSESWRDKQTGENKEITEWHRVVLFGKLAEVAGEYLKKGSQVYIEGQLRTRKWQDQGGQERYTTEVVVNVGGTMQMLGGRQQGGNAGAPAGGGAQGGNNNGWGQPQQPQGNNNQFSGGAQSRPQQPQSAPASNNNEVSRSSRRAITTSSVAARSLVRSSHRAHRPAITTNPQWISTTIFHSDFAGWNSSGKECKKPAYAGFFYARLLRPVTTILPEWPPCSAHAARCRGSAVKPTPHCAG